MNLRLAEIEQAEEICNLVNIAYRGDIGWTKETDIVEGDRATISEIKLAIQKNILLQAEEYAFSDLQVSKLIMVVVSQRIELISFYERRGYVKTGKVEKYPKNLNVGTPKTEGLTIEYLEKGITSQIERDARCAPAPHLGR